MKKILYIFLLFFALNIDAQDKYVTTAGNGTTCSEGSPCSIAYAFANAVAGETWYIKAGNYGNQTLTVANNGTSENPISFIGYKNTPGDIIANNGSTFSYGDSLDAAEMPLLDSGSPNSGTGITCSRDYVSFSNIQLTRYATGIRTTGTYNDLDNIIVVDVGVLTDTSYTGTGIWSESDYANITNCYVENAGAHGIVIHDCTGQYHNYNSVYADGSVTNATDYYYLFSGDLTDTLQLNTNHDIHNAYVERVGDLSHGGHGLVLKYTNNNNNFYDCTVKNTNLELSHNGCNYNSFYRISIIQGVGDGGAITVRDGAHHNYLEECTVTGGGGIRFTNNPNGTDELNYNAGHNNTFFNCTVQDATHGINFFYYNGNPTRSADDNTFENCTFLNLDVLFRVDRENSGTELKCCTLTNITTMQDYRPGFPDNVALNWQHENTTSSGLGFSLPAESDLGGCAAPPSPPITPNVIKARGGTLKTNLGRLRIITN